MPDAVCHLCGQRDRLERLEDAIGREPGTYRSLRVWVHPRCYDEKQAGKRDCYLALNGPLPHPGMPGWRGGRRFDDLPEQA
jgi:hypothetical protein